MSIPNFPAILPINMRNFLSEKDESKVPTPSGFPVPPIQTPPWFPRIRFLNTGAWLVNYEPFSGRNRFDGTIRIENHAAGRTASGDLYQRPGIFIPRPGSPPLQPPVWFPLPSPNPSQGIPILARSNYRFYLRITRIDETISLGETFKLGFQMYKYAGTDKNNFSFTQDPSDSDYTATMRWTTAPTGYPYPQDFAEGDVILDKTGASIARLKMGRVSEFYRKMTVEIDNVSGSELPLNNGVTGAGYDDWTTVYNRIGFEVNVITSDSDIAEPSGESWSRSELHQTMLAKRNKIDLDKEWHYYLLACKKNDDSAFGVMFDNRASDSNNVPREGLQISSHVKTSSNPGWGTSASMRFGTIAQAYFRTAHHELGHALGLRHNDDSGDGEAPVLDFSFMNQTGNAVSRSSATSPFLSSIKYNHADRNLYQLRHWPDIFIRPGGIEFGLASSSAPPITPQDTDIEVEAPGLMLNVQPLRDHSELPLGAPVRINVTLVNTSETAIVVPGDISLKSDRVSGTVTDPAGTAREFQSLFHFDKPEDQMKVLEKGESVRASITLLRGRQGALFPVSGIHQIAVKVSWCEGEGLPSFSAIGSATVMVTPPLDRSHAAAAHRLLTTPDVHLVLILGGDYLEDGVKAIQQALDDKTLRPHYAGTEAKRISKTNFGQPPDIDGASKLVSEADVVLSIAEKDKLTRLGVSLVQN